MVVDDDHIYGPGLIETMMRASVTLPGTAIGAQGWVSLPGRDPQAFPSFVVDTGYAAGPVLSSCAGGALQRCTPVSNKILHTNRTVGKKSKTRSLVSPVLNTP